MTLSSIRRRIAAVAAAIALSALGALPALAQADFNTIPRNQDLGALITNAARGASTVNSPAQTNQLFAGVACVFNMASHTGTPSTTFSIQMQDKASQAWVTLGTSGAITVDATPTVLVVYPAIQTATLPTNTVGFGLPVGRVWRVQQIVAGTTPGVTGTLGCNMIR